jgi:hypothetical protein
MRGTERLEPKVEKGARRLARALGLVLVLVFDEAKPPIPLVHQDVGAEQRRIAGSVRPGKAGRRGMEVAMSP